MDASQLTERLSSADRGDLRAILGRLERHTASAAGEVDWWETTLTVDRSLRATGRSREAAAAANHVARLVRHRAVVEGLGEVAAIRLARAAGELARATVAGLSPARLPALADVWGPLLVPARA